MRMREEIVRERKVKRERREQVMDIYCSIVTKVCSKFFFDHRVETAWSITEIFFCRWKKCRSPPQAISSHQHNTNVSFVDIDQRFVEN